MTQATAGLSNGARRLLSRVTTNTDSGPDATRFYVNNHTWPTMCELWFANLVVLGADGCWYSVAVIADAEERAYAEDYERAFALELDELERVTAAARVVRELDSVDVHGADAIALIDTPAMATATMPVRAGMRVWNVGYYAIGAYYVRPCLTEEGYSTLGDIPTMIAIAHGLPVDAIDVQSVNRA